LIVQPKFFSYLTSFANLFASIHFRVANWSALPKMQNAQDRREKPT